jgi:hypothetical protein
MPARWTIVAYRTPAEPSTARVSAWRALHRLGGLYLGPTVCLLPARLADRVQLERIRARVDAAGGTFDMLDVESFTPEAEAALRRRYNEARTAEYAEIVERADEIVEELEREGRRDKFTFAEVEENETGLTKIRQWLRQVAARDLFESDARQDAEAGLRRAEAKLAAFVEEAIAREAGGQDATGSAARGLRIVDGGR